MTIDRLLDQLDAVRRTSRGWVARCPAHRDKSPSLSVQEGERGVLLKCWTGCTVREICAALELKVGDLFFDAGLPRGQRPAPKPPRVDRRRLALDFELHGLALQERAEGTLRTATGVDVSAWSDADLEAVMNVLANAHDDLVRAKVLFDVADSQREKAYQEDHAPYR